MKANTPVNSTSPSTMWEALERILGQIAVPAIWRRELGGTFENLSALFLECTRQTAQFVPCPIGCGCWHEVVSEPGGLPVGVCTCRPWRCQDLRLELEDLQLWQLSWLRLARALCHALGLDARRRGLGLPSTAQIGSWAADAVPVLLTIQSSRAEFAGMVARIVARLRQPLILLAPTARQVDAASKELLGNVGAAFFPLNTIVELAPDGTLQALRPPGEIFAQFAPQPKGDLDADTARRAFALVQQLESAGPRKPPTVLTVFRLYCQEALSAGAIARKFGCGKTTVVQRLNLIRSKTGLAPSALRQLSSQFERIEEQATDSRAARIHRRRLIEDGEQDED